MDKLIAVKIKDLESVLLKLEESCSMEYSEITRDSALLRFELAPELSWKILKLYLEKNYQIESPFPTTVYREALKTSLFSPDEIENCLKMVQDRNRMVHDYNQEWADELYKKIVNTYLPLLNKIAEVVSKN